MQYLGIDIGGTAVKIGAVNAEGEIIGEVGEYSVNFDGYETPILETVIKSTKDFLVKQNEDAKAYVGIGVSATGGINTKEGRVDGSAGHIRNWLGSKIKERMEAEFFVPTFVLNDANAAALGEVWKGAAKGLRDVVVMTIGTGVGGGIVVDGKILLGRSGFGGEIGHTPLIASSGDCPCGSTGCLEYYASMTALVKSVKALVKEGRLPGIHEEDVNGRLIFEETAKGNKELTATVDRWIGYIVSGIVGMVHIFNPEMVLIGGGVSRQKALFVDKVREKVLDKVMKNFAVNLEIEACALGNDAGIIGAAYFAKTELGK